jgi:hypothetical protein
LGKAGLPEGQLATWRLAFSGTKIIQLRRRRLLALHPAKPIARMGHSYPFVRDAGRDRVVYRRKCEVESVKQVALEPNRPGQTKKRRKCAIVSSGCSSGMR